MTKFGNVNLYTYLPYKANIDVQHSVYNRQNIGGNNFQHDGTRSLKYGTSEVGWNEARSLILSYLPPSFFLSSLPPSTPDCSMFDNIVYYIPLQSSPCN